MDLVGADIDHSHPEARDDIIKWGKWIINEVGACGFRFDAVKVRSPSHFFSSALSLLIPSLLDLCPCVPPLQPTIAGADFINPMWAAHRQELHCKLYQNRPQRNRQNIDVRSRRVLEGFH